MGAEAAEQFEVFRRCDLLAGLSWRCLQKLQAEATEVFIPRYESAFRKDEPPDAFYILRQGLVCISVQMGASRNIVVALHGPGRAFGWSALLGETPRPASAMALADSIAWKIPISALREVADSDPACSAALYKNISSTAFGLLMSTAAHFNGEARPSEHIERCPALIENGFFNWRLSGAVIEARCAGRPGCRVSSSSCPIVNGPTSEWATLMLGKFTSLAPDAEHVGRTVLAAQ